MVTRLKPESNNGNRDSSYPSFSIIIEWENRLFSEERLAVKMLQQLSKQIIEISPNLSSKPEVIIVYDSDNLEHYEMERIVNEPLEPCGSMIDLRIIPAAKLRYYELKNYGFRQSHGDIIIFLDCDVVPEEGWLVAMLEPFQNPGISVLGGMNNAPKGLYAKAFAVATGLRLGSTPFVASVVKLGSEYDGQSHEVEYFNANNVAFRREIIEANPFPPLPQFRRSCAVLGDKLRLQGHKIFFQPKSRTYHPPPHGLQHFVAKALSEGHDTAISKSQTRKVKASMPNDNQQNRLSLHEIFSHYRKKYRSVRLNPKDKVGTFGIVLSYLLFMYIGYQLSSVKPKFILGRLKV